MLEPGPLGPFCLLLVTWQAPTLVSLAQAREGAPSPCAERGDRHTHSQRLIKCLSSTKGRAIVTATWESNDSMRGKAWHRGGLVFTSSYQQHSEQGPQLPQTHATLARPLRKKESLPLAVIMENQGSDGAVRPGNGLTQSLLPRGPCPCPSPGSRPGTGI